MTAVLVEAVFESLTGQPEDRVVNTWVWKTPTSPPTNAELTDIGIFLSSFYNDSDPVTTHPVCGSLSTVLSRAANAAMFKFYNIDAHLDGSPHGSPIKLIPWTLGPHRAPGTNLPSEIAVVLSYHGPLTDVPQEAGNTRPAARRRGRVYVGPINSNAAAADVDTSVVYVSQDMRETLAGAAQRLMVAPTAVWSNWSRADAQIHTVTGGFVDNAFDTQRRRGEQATLRRPWGI
jgi:hypothetical protein